jgi:putative oxidoreductase
VQRFFSTFADGWPGGGLLIQRLLVGATLLYFAFTCLTAAPVCAVAISRSIAALGGILLIAGLWTPFAGVLVTGAEAWIALSVGGNTETPILLAILGLTLAMIGPGAWSVDAWLFGRKHIVLPEP